MSEFASLITGAVAGALLRNSPTPFNISVDMPTDSNGDFLHEIYVKGNESGEELVITVRDRYDTPESVDEKMRAATQVVHSAQEHLG